MENGRDAEGKEGLENSINYVRRVPRLHCWKKSSRVDNAIFRQHKLGGAHER